VGATVITPKAGFYSKPLSTLDFASLYPSIEASNNLCFSTLVTDRSQLAFLKTSDGKKLYQDFEIEHPTPDGRIEKRKYAFVTHVRSVLADLLIHLLSSRKAVKRQMEALEDPFLYEVYNKRQMALKVVCNSVYGFTGVDVEKGMLSCKPVAAATTLIGRRLIGLTKDFVEANYKGAFVAYGDTDSVMIHWGVDTLEEAFHLGEDAAKKVTQYLRSVMQGEQATTAGKEQRDVKAMTEILKLEHEKEYWPYLLFKKKNYAGRKWTPKSLNPLVLKDTIDKKGIQAVRRDTIPFIADISNQILDALLLENSTEKAIQLVRDGLKAVSLEQIPFEKYITSKSIKGSYSNMAIPHVLAWQRMRDRGDDDLPPVGGRMPFVIVAGDTPLATRAEHPLYARSNKKKLDTEYYITASVNPLKKLLQFATNQDTLDEVFREALNTSTSRSTKSLLEFLSDDQVSSTTKLAGTKRVAIEQSGAAKKKREKKETSLDAFFM
jgi:DNA polymerase delta subunit 1